MSTVKEINELTDLKAAEVSVVDAGANLKKRFPITKRKQLSEELSMSADEMEILKAVLETEVDEEAKLGEWFEKAKVSPAAQNAVKAALRALSSYKEELPKDVIAKLSELGGYPVPEAKADDKGVPAPEDEDEMDKKAKKEKEEKIKKGLPPEYETIFKAQAEELKAMKTANEEITKALKVEKDKRELAEWTEKARKELTHFPGKSADELGLMLKGLNDLNPESATKQFELLKSASDAMKTSSVFKEAGRFNMDAGGDDSAEAKIEKLAKGLVEKSSDGEMTIEKARVLVQDRNPELYNQYLSENDIQTGRRA